MNRLIRAVVLFAFAFALAVTSIHAEQPLRASSLLGSWIVVDANYTTGVDADSIGGRFEFHPGVITTQSRSGHESLRLKIVKHNISKESVFLELTNLKKSVFVKMRLVQKGKIAKAVVVASTVSLDELHPPSFTKGGYDQKLKLRRVDEEKVPDTQNEWFDDHGAYKGVRRTKVVLSNNSDDCLNREKQRYQDSLTIVLPTGIKGVRKSNGTGVESTEFDGRD